MITKLHRTAAHVGMLHSVGIASKRRQVPRPVYPLLVETEYASKIIVLLGGVDVALLELRTRMPSLLASSNAAMRHDSGETDFALRLIDEARDKMGDTISENDIRALARFAGDRTSIAQRLDLQRAIKAGLGVDVPLDEQRTREMLINFTNQNAQLIGTIPTRQIDDVANLTMRAFTKRMTPDTYAAELQKIADVTEGKARQIARDQIGTLNGQLAEERHRELGIEAYFWMTRRDSHVRPEHARREGRRYLWSKPPVDGAPGIPYGCRCTAKPDLSGVLAALAKNQAHGSPVGF